MAEGNPLFIEQLTAFRKEDGSAIGMAGSIRGVLDARLDRLGREERAVLERASVVGRSFSLVSVLGADPGAGTRARAERGCSTWRERV